MVGKSDFNENPVVSLDLDLDFGLRLRICQYNSEFIQWLPSYAFRKVTANTKKGVLYYFSVKCVVLMDVQMNYANTDTLADADADSSRFMENASLTRIVLIFMKHL